ncbi:hypothetical protein AWB78_07375 [Caballeronia calidae]|uniref:Type 4 secretion system PilS N-terminal domain-containing protein n=2 Tax=Caballeronia calidae TaxID=1777139 RepID=A0A158EEN5_9BURK|nr:hypothetical protein AWB78_07375 [Caballeronia calidae]
MRDWILENASIIVGLILLALAGSIIAVGFSTARTSGLASEITLIESSARGGFAQSNQGYANFTTANAADLATGGMFPQNMVRNGVLYDDWGNAIQLSSANNGTNGVIAFGGGGSESVDSCKTVVTGLKDYVSLVVANSTFTQSTQPDALSAEQACAGGTATIALTFQ